MNAKVLFVDDEPNVLQAYRRALRKRVDMDTAEGGEQALEMIADRGPYAVIISDMRMPGMNGVELLVEVRNRAPDTVRMMLTGNSDQQTAVDAVNKGDIFRFLTKPCEPQILAHAVAAGLEQHRLITAEKELLRHTLSGSIRVLAEVLSLVNPEAFGRTARLPKTVRTVAKEMGLLDEWWLEPLVLLSQIGCVILPGDILSKVTSGDGLTPQESKLFDRHPLVGADLLTKIPRMGQIAEAVRYQDKCFDGTGVPDDDVRGEAIPLGARILKVVLDLDQGEVSGLPRPQALARLKRHAEWYDPDVLGALERAVGADVPMDVREVRIKELTIGMILAADVITQNGALVVCNGQEVTSSLHQRLLNFVANGGVVTEPLEIFAPPASTRAGDEPALAQGVG